MNTINYLTEGKGKTHKIYEGIILEHMKRRESNPEDDASPLIDDMIEAFLDEKKRRGEGEDGFYSTPQLHHLLADLFGAGLDTTMTTMRWFVLLMAAHPDAQVRYYSTVSLSTNLLHKTHI
jgi:ecdysteroid 25-hydroxylase CYP306A1